MVEALLPPDGRAAGAARRTVAAELRRLGLPTLADDASLLVSEVVTNVIVHAVTSPRLRVEAIPGGLRVEVADDSPVAPALRRPGTTSTTGRGIRLVETLASSWGWESRHGGKVVWFELLVGDGSVA